MKPNSQMLSKIKIWFVLGLGSIVCFASFDTTSLAETAENPHNRKIKFIPANNQPKPPSNGTPKADHGTGSRGNCPYKANVPELTSLGGDGALTTTLGSHPSFWIYVPYSTSEVSHGEFSLQDGEQDLYRAKIELPSNIPGIVEVSLPSTISPLKVDREYRWYFEIDCSNELAGSESTALDTLTGIVRPVKPSAKLNRELKMARSPLEIVDIYAKYGIWYETVTELAQLIILYPHNSTYQRLWSGLLGQSNVSKTDVANESLVGKARLNMFNHSMPDKK